MKINKENQRNKTYITTLLMAAVCAVIMIVQRRHTALSIFEVGGIPFSTSDMFILIPFGIGGPVCGIITFAAVFVSELIGRGDMGTLFSLAVYLFAGMIQGYITYKGWYRSFGKTVFAALILVMFLGSSWYALAYYLFRSGFEVYQDIPLWMQYVSAVPEVIVSQAIMYVFFNYADDSVKLMFGTGYIYTEGYKNTGGSVIGASVTAIVLGEAVILGACAALFGGLQFGEGLPKGVVLVMNIRMFMLIMCAALPVAIVINELIARMIVIPINRMAAVMRQYFGAEQEKRRASIRELEALDIKSGDEIGDLYGDLRCMVAQMSDYIDTLQKKNELEEQIARQTEMNVHLTREFMVALAKTVDAKDHYTSGHSMRVAKYSREIAKRLGKGAEEQENILAMGLLHDIGKIGVSELIINKTSRLTDEEYAEIKKHPVTGYDILKNVTGLPGLATGARWHHERYDGRGYPDGLAGKDIPEEARIIGVADAYDAMTSRRAYSDVRPQSEVRAEIIRCRGTQFDPVIADIMVAMIDEDKAYRMREM